MVKQIGKGDWEHSYFEAYLDVGGDYSQVQLPITGAACVCFDPNGNIVLSKHKDEGYDLLGGKTEPGETVEDTLKREALEEGGVELQSWEYLGYYHVHQKENASPEYKTKYPKESVIVFFVAQGEIVTEPYGEEIAGSETFKPEEIQNLEISNHPMLNAALNILKN